MHLDDIENESAPRVEQYLVKIKIIRSIAKKIISFLAQLEDFQKKLWLKKKFVVETNYCITLDRIPKKLYSEIASNDAQWIEWEQLGFITTDETEENKYDGELNLGGQKLPNIKTIEYLERFPHLVLDTKFFDEEFKYKLLASIDDIDEQCNGLLIHSENFQALNLLQERYKEQVKCIYIDPPYNTNATPIIYKNEYKHSSWISLIYDRVLSADNLMTTTAFFVSAIDHAELYNLGKINDSIYGEDKRLAIVTVQHNPKGRNQAKFFSENTEYLLFYCKDPIKSNFVQVAIDKKISSSFNLKDELGKYRYENFLRARSVWSRKNKPNNWYPIYVSKDLKHITSSFHKDYYELFPKTKQGDFSWKNIKESFDELNKKNYFTAKKVNDEIMILHKYREQQVLKNIWIDKKYQSEFNGTNLLKSILGGNLFDFPKSIYAVLDIIKITTNNKDIILDYFAGSGTTGHAVIDLNREDGGRRKYILVEMGDHFETTLKPRIQKVVYSKEWKDGKPVNSESGISHCFKYIRLESYEDCLNNLKLSRNEEQSDLLTLHDELREDYMLNYMLDIETRGSLLNIDSFDEPFSYQMNIATGTVGETKPVNIDLVETFNYLIGVKVKTIDTIRGVRVITGENLEGERILILWRKVKDMDSDALDKWFKKQGYNTLDMEFNVVYVNGDNNLENLKKDEQSWKVRLIEEEFQRIMFEESE